MRALLALLLLSQFAAADFLEIRKVVEAGKGSKTYDDPDGGAGKLTVSDELIAGDRHLAEAYATQTGTSSTNGGPPEPNYGVAAMLTPEGEQRMIAATKDAKAGVTRLAVILDGKIKSAPRIMSAPLGKNFAIYTESMEEAKALTDKLRVAIKAGKAASFEIRQVVEAGQGTLKVKLPKSGEELTLSNKVIVNRKDLAKFSPQAGSAQHQIAFELTEEGGKRLEEATKDTEGGKLRLAVLVGGKAVAAPVVRSSPLGRNFLVSAGEGDEGKALAEEIEAALKAGK